MAVTVPGISPGGTNLVTLPSNVTPLTEIYSVHEELLLEVHLHVGRSTLH